MSEDLGFDGESTSKKGAKVGRRAKQSKAPAAPEFEPPESQQTTSSAPEIDDGPPKPNRISGWGEDAPKRSGRKLGEGMEQFEDDDIFQGLDIESELERSNKPGRRQQQSWGNDVEDERLRPHSPDKSDDSDNDIPVIPDLEEQQEEDITQTVAYAPNISVNRVATYRELDNELLKQAAFLTLDNEIDLKLLTKSLSTEEDLKEEDKPWDWDRLFTEVTSELLTQWEKNEEAEPATGSEPMQQTV